MGKISSVVSLAEITRSPKVHKNFFHSSQLNMEGVQLMLFCKEHVIRCFPYACLHDYSEQQMCMLRAKLCRMNRSDTRHVQQQGCNSYFVHMPKIEICLHTLSRNT